jgi:hypothetical protein
MLPVVSKGVCQTTPVVCRAIGETKRGDNDRHIVPCDLGDLDRKPHWQIRPMRFATVFTPSALHNGSSSGALEGQAKSYVYNITDSTRRSPVTYSLFFFGSSTDESYNFLVDPQIFEMTLRDHAKET